MIFVLVVLPAVAGALKGAAAGMKQYRLGKDLKENKQKTFPASTWNQADWERLPEESKRLFIKGIVKRQFIEEALKRKEAS